MADEQDTDIENTAPAGDEGAAPVAGGGAPDAGSPGGMGGVHGGFDTGGRPPGGVSPLQAEEELKRD